MRLKVRNWRRVHLLEHGMLLCTLTVAYTSLRLLTKHALISGLHRSADPMDVLLRSSTSSSTCSQFLLQRHVARMHIPLQIFPFSLVNLSFREDHSRRTQMPNLPPARVLGCRSKAQDGHVLSVEIQESGAMTADVAWLHSGTLRLR
jgi:hypothetical protein